MKDQAHPMPPTRPSPTQSWSDFDTAGDLGDLTLAQLALAIACGIALAVLGWASVVFVVAIGTPQ